MDETITVGLIETVTICDLDKKVEARIDSGATIGSIDEDLAEELDTAHIGHKIVKSSHGTTRRKVIEADIELGGKKVTGKFTVFDRSHMTYQVLIGQDVLKQGFLIDPQK